MSAELQAVVDKVAALKSVDASLMALTAGLADRVRATAGDRQAALDLAADIDAETAAIAAAVTANTVP